MVAVLDDAKFGTTPAIAQSLLSGIVEHYRPIAKAENNIQYMQKVVLTVSDMVFSSNRHTEPAITLADETVELEIQKYHQQGRFNTGGPSMVRIGARVDILRYGFADKFLVCVKTARCNTQIAAIHQNDGDTPTAGPH